MEFEFLSILMIVLVVSLFLFIMFLALKLLSVTNSSSSPLNLIPGPRKLPFIGHLHLLVGNTLPHHRAFKALADKYGPLMHLQLGELPFLVVSSVEIAKQILKTHDINFSNRPQVLAAKTMCYNCNDIAFSPYGEYWRYLRKICTLELLSTRRVESFRHIREEENRKLAKWIASNEGSPINLSKRIFLTSYDIITRASLGKKTMEQGTFTSIIIETTKLLMGLSIGDLYPSITFLPIISGFKLRMERMQKKTDRILDSIIEEHRDDASTERKADDLTDVLLKYQQDGSELSLTTDNVKAVLMDIFGAGSGSSATVVDWAMSEMLKNHTSILKRAQEEVRQVFDGKRYVDEADVHELKYLKLVIKETLRLHPPGPLLLPRQSSQRCEVNGYEIPAKTRVIVNAWALGRDAKFWNDADKFIPERFLDNSIDFKGNNLEYIPFGAGRRICPGISFGLAGVEYALAMLLYHFDWELSNGIKNEQLDMTESFGAAAKRKHDLILIPTLKRPLLAAG